MALTFEVDEIAQWVKKGIERTINEDSGEPLDDNDLIDLTLSNNSKVNQELLTMSGFNYQEIASKYNTDVDAAREAVNALDQEIRKDLPGESDEVYHFLVMQEIGKSLSKSSPLDFAKENADAFTGTVIAVSRVKDLNDYQKRQCWAEFKRDEKTPMIRLEKDDKGVERKVPIDTTEKLRDGSLNPNYNQPIPYKRAREMFMIHGSGKDMEFSLVRMDTDEVAIGKTITIYGSKSPSQGKAYESVIRGWHGGYEEGEMNPDAFTLADTLYKEYYQETKDKNQNVIKHQAIAIADVQDLPSYGYYIVKGYVNSIKGNDDGTKVYLSVADDDGNSIRASTTYAPLMADVDDLAKGDEVVAIIERSSFKNDNGDYISYNVLMGAVKNNVGNAKSDALKRLQALRGNKA